MLANADKLQRLCDDAYTALYEGDEASLGDDGAVLPILHLNGWKIANPTLFARMSDAELDKAS